MLLVRTSCRSSDLLREWCHLAAKTVSPQGGAPQSQATMRAHGSSTARRCVLPVLLLTLVLVCLLAGAQSTHRFPSVR